MAATVATVATMAGAVYLYGNSRTGAGFIVEDTATGKQAGNGGDPDAALSFTEAVFLAAQFLQSNGRPHMWVFHPGCTEFTVVDLRGSIPYYGDLDRRPVPDAWAVTIDLDQVVKADTERRAACR